MSHSIPCQARGCDRIAPGADLRIVPGVGTVGKAYCCLHDGLHQPVVCHCPVARPDSIGQCTRCWRVIVTHPLHSRILADAWPELAHQPIEQQGAA